MELLTEKDAVFKMAQNKTAQCAIFCKQLCNMNYVVAPLHCLVVVGHVPNDVEDDCWDEDAEDETEQLPLNDHGDSQPVACVLHGDIFQGELCDINRAIVFKVARLKMNYLF